MFWFYFLIKYWPAQRQFPVLRAVMTFHFTKEGFPSNFPLSLVTVRFDALKLTAVYLRIASQKCKVFKENCLLKNHVHLAVYLKMW